MKMRSVIVITLFSKSQMEGTMNFVSEWCVLTSVWAREWQYKDILTEFDDQVWKYLSEKWQKVPVRTRGKSCLVLTSLCPERCPIKRLRLGTSCNLNETPCQGWRGREANEVKMAS